MRRTKNWFFFLVIGLGFISGCSHPSWFVGTGGKYNEAMIELTRRSGGNIDKAIDNLENIARQDPTYRDSLTLLGRAYYRKARYQDAHLIAERALAVNNEDEIAWLVLGVAQLRLGYDEKGLETLKGGLTLFNKVNGSGYRGYQYWDRAGKVRVAIRRAVLVALKGLEEKDNIIKSVENVFAAWDEEEFFRRFEQAAEREREYQ